MFPWFLLTCGIVCLLSDWNLPKYTIHYSKWGRVWLEKENNGKETPNNGKKDVEIREQPKEKNEVEFALEYETNEQKTFEYEWENEGEWKVRKRKEVIKN